MNYKLVQADEALTLRGVVKKDGRYPKTEDLGIIKKPLVLMDEDQILFVGTKNEFNAYYKNHFTKETQGLASKPTQGKNKVQNKSNNKIQNKFQNQAHAKLRNKLQMQISAAKSDKIEEIKTTGVILPGFVESHTHTVFAGDRRHEFELRNQGVSYQDIAKRGGGIQFTMDETQKSSEAKLYELAHQRVLNFMNQGITVLEIKSGYGADLRTELKILKVIEKLKNSFSLNSNIKYKLNSNLKSNLKANIEIKPTYLGLHSIPQGQTKSEYMELVLKKHLPQITKQTKIRHADIFCDEGFFDHKDLKDYVSVLKSLGWTFSAHTDQLSSTGVGLKASQLGATSISHCVQMKDAEILKVSQTDTVFNLLPAADFYLNIPYPKARKMLDNGGCVSLATDFNPGSSPTQNINFVGVLARLEMKMTLPEVLAAYTYNSAKGLGLHHKHGALLPNYSSNIQILNQSWDELFYQV